MGSRQFYVYLTKSTCFSPYFCRKTKQAMNKEQQLTFNLGITNVPSDATCDDNALEECLNLVHDGAEIKPIQEPVLDIKVELHNGIGVQEVLFVHKIGGQSRYIVRLIDGSIAWGIKAYDEVKKEYYYEGKEIFLQTDGTVQIQAIGKTIILLVDEVLNYFLWKEDSYKPLGNKIPEPDVTLYVSLGKFYSAHYDVMPDDLTTEEVLEYIRGLYDEATADAKKHNVFTLPFFARVAVEMFDGTYTLQSVPTLLFPCVRGNFELYTTPGHAHGLTLSGSELYYSGTYDYSDWSDIVTGVSVFVTRGVEVTDFEKDKGFGVKSYQDSVSMVGGIEKYISEEVTGKPMPRGDAKVVEDLKEVMQNFYKFGDLGKKISQPINYSKVPVKDGTLTNLVTQESLKDDYFSHCTIGGKSIMAYNNRLIVSNITRDFYKGAKRFIGYSSGEQREVTIYVGIDSDNGERIIENKFTTDQYLDLYFYYPDPRARWVKIIDGDNVLTSELTIHPFLNGAYFLRRLPGSENTTEGQRPEPTGTNDDVHSGGGSFGRAARRSAPSDTPVPNETPERFANQLYISEVNNPWNFGPIGNITAGMGDIIGLSTVTKAISQGQFGQYPLIIFSSDGIWAASLNAEGVFVAVHPMSREVCNNIESITQTDGAIFFSSEKGLMVILENNVVKCVSEQLHSNFPKFLRNARIAYDYRDSLLWIMSMSVSENYVYNIKTGTISTGNYFYNIDEQTSKPRTGTRRATSFLPGRELEYKHFNGLVSVDAVESGAFDETQLKKSVANGVIASAEIDYWNVDDINHFIALTKDDAVTIYWKWIMDYSVDGKTYLSDQRYKKRKDLVNGDIVSCGSSAYKVENGALVLISSSGMQHFESSVISTSDLRHDEKFDLEAVKNKIKEDNPDVTNFVVFTNVVFDYSVDRFMLEVVIYYDLPNGLDGAYRGFFTSWDAIESERINASTEYMDASGVKTDVIFYRTDDDGYKYLYLWGYSEDEGKDTLIRADNVDVDEIISQLDENKVITGNINYETWASEVLQQWKNSMADNVDILDDWKVSEGGDIVYNKATKTFVERRLYSFVWQNRKESGARYYAQFEGSSGYVPSEGDIFVYGAAYYKWSSGDLVLWKSSLTSIVNNYPDTMFFKQGDGLYSLLERPQPEDDTAIYSGTIITRPIKFENGLALKSVMQLRHVMQMEGRLAIVIKASNDLKNWTTTHSLKGTPWRYYQFELHFNDMKATDRYSGMVIETQERRTNRLR